MSLSMNFRLGELESTCLKNNGSNVSTPKSGIPAANIGMAPTAFCFMHSASLDKHGVMNGAESLEMEFCYNNIYLTISTGIFLFNRIYMKVEKSFVLFGSIQIVVRLKDVYKHYRAIYKQQNYKQDIKTFRFKAKRL